MTLKTLPQQFDGFKKSGKDAGIEEAIENHCQKFQISPGNAIKLFPVLARRQMLKRFLAHHELFLKTLEIPGDIAELGVFRGLGMFTWANFLESYCIGDRTKIVYGFDNWSGFSEIREEDGKEKPQTFKHKGGFSPASFYDEVREAISLFDEDRFIPWKERIKMIDGDIEKTAPLFATENPGVRFSLVHFDCDIYKPTKAALAAFWPRLSRGGVMIFDEYSIADWPGETQAVDEFFADKKEVRIKKLPWTNAPAGYVIKES